MRIPAALLILMFGICPGPAVASQGEALVGHWAGTIVLVPAEREVDVIVDFRRDGEQVRGQLWFPLAGDGAHTVDGLTVQSDRVSFSVRDKAGTVSAFVGHLSQDGAGLKGVMKENGQSIPFVLQRSQPTAPAREVPTYKLSGDGLQLKEAFNKDIGKTRLLLLLDLGSFSGKMALRVVQRYVMDHIKDGDLRVYVVWRAPEMQDPEKIAKTLQLDAALATDPRITHFWFTGSSLSTVLEPMLAPYQPVSNPCLLFAPERSWTATAPLPDRFRQSPKMGGKSMMNPGQKLNGLELAWDVQTLLVANRGH